MSKRSRSFAIELQDAPTPVADDVNHRTVVGRSRRAQTRARIVGAAATVYAAKGPDVAVIDDFVKAAGMSRGTFYNHFTTTSELLTATIEWFDNTLAETILGIIGHYPDLIEKSSMAMRLHLHWITSDPTLCAFFSRVPQVADVGRLAAREQLRQGVALGVFKVADEDAAFDLVFGTITETIRRVALAPERPKRCDEVVTMVLVSLGIAPARIRQVMALPLPAISVTMKAQLALLPSQASVS